VEKIVEPVLDNGAPDELKVMNCQEKTLNVSLHITIMKMLTGLNMDHY
jgi:hypothetical protein